MSNQNHVSKRQRKDKGSVRRKCLLSAVLIGIVSVYNHESGIPVSDCTTVVLNVNYK